MHVALGRLHLTVALEDPKPERRAVREIPLRDAVADDLHRRAQLRQEVEAARERWRRHILPPSWLR